MEFLYSDKHMVVCIKKPGILSQGDEFNGENMVSLLKNELNEDIYPVHRLDRNVGGVMVFAKTKEAAKKLSDIISDKDKFTKEYLAVIHGEAEETETLRDLIYKSSRENKAFVVKKERKGVKEGVLEYLRVNTVKTPKGTYSLLRIRLHTGRFHQIRVQFASRKKPLVGDGKYGSKDNKCDVALWSYHIAFDQKSFKSTPNTDVYPWNLFADDINKLK